ncbi:uncharacterized protein LOC110701644 [Chenopodium quinoa]|uniref:uncharacterized protein LOC110701644 n=1 Tax=Chenopodium quinoa TaxID=63459 RepID=UPI000B785ADD|nr:uncharacterized protein LOC110701644 [Chenopodium quinoa]
MQCDPICFLCNLHPESIEHLLFECSFIKVIWERILAIFGCNRSILSFDAEVMWVSKICRKDRAKNRLLGMCFAESVYHIWLQRNSLIFTGNFKSGEPMIRDILFAVASRCSGSDRNLLIL